MAAEGDAPAPQRGAFRRREEVLETAARLFFERGYAATSTGDIARELGLHRGSIYYYLSTKEELLFELVRDRYASGIALLEQLPEQEGDALARLRWLIEQHVAALAVNRVPSALALNESRSLSSEHRAEMAEAEAAYRDGLTALIADGQRSGTVRDDVDPALAAMAVLGAANWTHRWYDGSGGVPPGALARQFAAVLTRGLAPAASVAGLVDRLESQARRIAQLEAALGDAAEPPTEGR